MAKILMVIFCGVISMTASAKNIVDIHGANEKSSKKILKTYSKKISETMDNLIACSTHLSNEHNEHLLQKYAQKQFDLSEKIKKEYDFDFVDFQVVMYPKKDSYTTIEVIEKNQSERLRFVKPHESAKAIQQKQSVKNDLIDKRIKFDNLEMQLYQENKLDLKDIVCPVYHCFVGFKHPQLKPYLSVFKKGVVEEKKLIIETLNKDKNPQRRAAAAFLVGHFNDPHEILSVLTPHINDVDDLVRNNVMRVIGSTLSKTKIDHIDLQPFLDMLDSPYTTDRNKALYIILEASSMPSTRDLIIQNKNKLIDLLALKQPNNHDIAYKILQKISAKDFGEHNISAWKNGLK